MLGESVVMRIARCRIDWDAFVRACGDDLDRDREITVATGYLDAIGVYEKTLDPAQDDSRVSVADMAAVG